MRALVLVLLAAAASASLAAPPVPAAGPDGLAVLQYHPYPDPDAAAGLGGDPFGVEEYDRAPTDRMAGYYGATWFPTVVFDGVRTESAATQGPAKDADGLLRAYRAHLDARRAEDKPLLVTLDGRVEGRNLTLAAAFEALTPVASPRVALRLVVFEDPVTFDGGNGVTEHRFLVRAVLPVAYAAFPDAGANATVERALALDAGWDAGRIGAAAFAQNEDAAGAGWEDREALAAVAWRVGEPAATGAHVLVESYTATWCAPCKAGEAALEALLAGAPTTDDARASYLRPPRAPALLAGVAAAVLLAVAVARRPAP